MVITEYKTYIAQAEAANTWGNACAVCNADSSAGNGYFCALHFAEVSAMKAAEWAETLVTRAADRSASARQAAQSRRERKAWENGGDVAPTIFEDGKRTDSPRPKNYSRARAIRSR